MGVSSTDGTDKKPARSGLPRHRMAAWGRELLERIAKYLDDLITIVLMVFSLVTILGMRGWTTGGLITPWVNLLQRWLGWGALVIPLAMLAGAACLGSRRLGDERRIPWERILWSELFIVALLGLFSLLDGADLSRAESGQGGGLIGWGIAILFQRTIGTLWAGIGLLLLGIISGWQGIGAAIWAVFQRREKRRGRIAKDRAIQELKGTYGQRTERTPEKPRSIRRLSQLPRVFHKNFQVPEAPDERPAKPRTRDDRLPSPQILDQSALRRIHAEEINLAAGLIEKTLADFGLPVQVVDFKTGPTVTQYLVEPGYIEQASFNGQARRHKVRVSQISALANDLALALSAPSVRVEAPIPGKPYVGIEVPNHQSDVVSLRSILESEPFHTIGSPLAIALGRDVAGMAVAADLAAMPHLLIAGTTGSGKSVCMTSLATCLVMSNHPEDLRLVLIDPKMVELVRFNGLPHLLGKVETQLERILGVLRWCTIEMDRRYRLLEEAKARNLESYNRRARRHAGLEPLPRIIVMIDELADLMMIIPDQTERTLVRLAQMARAIGMHLIVATQRPSTDVVTGLIKANFPARISFAVASSIDSRVILDTPGAERLLGRGDMLYLSPEGSTPIRLQGILVSDREIESVIRYWEQIHPSEEIQSQPPWEDLLVRQQAMADRDEILEQAIEIVKAEGEASASMLQRRLRVGYPRAARLMDELEEIGVVGPSQSGGKTREVLIDEDDDPLKLNPSLET